MQPGGQLLSWEMEFQEIYIVQSVLVDLHVSHTRLNMFSPPLVELVVS